MDTNSWDCKSCGKDVELAWHVKPQFCMFCGVKYKAPVQDVSDAASGWQLQLTSDKFPQRYLVRDHFAILDKEGK
jgi:ribosomal protein L37E